MPLFFHKTEKKTVRAYNHNLCPPPIDDWVLEKPDYQQKAENKEKLTKEKENKESDVKIEATEIIEKGK